MTTITAVTAHDVRFPTSLTMDGSDAMNKDGDYSAAYVVLHTDDPALEGYGFTFTIGRGNDLCVEAARQRASAPGRAATSRMLCRTSARLYRELPSDSQLRWLGPEKGVVHLALAAVMNAMWDLAARQAGKPLWRLLADMTPEQLVDAADLRYLSDALTPRRGHRAAARRRADPRRADRGARGPRRLPLLHHDRRMARLLRREAPPSASGGRRRRLPPCQAQGRRRPGGRHPALRIAREVIGWDANLMIDANQVWDVPEAIEWMSRLAEFDPLWIEEPTSPDDILGHAAIRQAVAPDRRRHRRARHEPGAVQADVPGRGDRLLPAGRGPARQRQRDPLGLLHGREVRGPGVPARGRRRALRARPAPVDLRLRRGVGHRWRTASPSTSTTFTSTSSIPASWRRRVRAADPAGLQRRDVRGLGRRPTPSPDGSYWASR